MPEGSDRFVRGELNSFSDGMVAPSIVSDIGDWERRDRDEHWRHGKKKHFDLHGGQNGLKSCPAVLRYNMMVTTDSVNCNIDNRLVEKINEEKKNGQFAVVATNVEKHDEKIDSQNDVGDDSKDSMDKSVKSLKARKELAGLKIQTGKCEIKKEQSEQFAKIKIDTGDYEKVDVSEKFDDKSETYNSETQDNVYRAGINSLEKREDLKKVDDFKKVEPYIVEKPNGGNNKGTCDLEKLNDCKKMGTETLKVKLHTTEKSMSDSSGKVSVEEVFRRKEQINTSLREINRQKIEEQNRSRCSVEEETTVKSRLDPSINETSEEKQDTSKECVSQSSNHTPLGSNNLPLDFNNTHLGSFDVQLSEAESDLQKSHGQDLFKPQVRAPEESSWCYSMDSLDSIESGQTNSQSLEQDCWTSMVPDKNKSGEYEMKPMINVDNRVIEGLQQNNQAVFLFNLASRLCPLGLEFIFQDLIQKQLSKKSSCGVFSDERKNADTNVELEKKITDHEQDIFNTDKESDNNADNAENVQERFEMDHVENLSFEVSSNIDDDKCKDDESLSVTFDSDKVSEDNKSVNCERDFETQSDELEAMESECNELDTDADIEYDIDEILDADEKDSNDSEKFSLNKTADFYANMEGTECPTAVCDSKSNTDDSCVIVEEIYCAKDEPDKTAADNPTVPKSDTSMPKRTYTRRRVGILGNHVVVGRQCSDYASGRGDRTNSARDGDNGRDKNDKNRKNEEDKKNFQNNNNNNNNNDRRSNNNNNNSVADEGCDGISAGLVDVEEAPHGRSIEDSQIPDNDYKAYKKKKHKVHDDFKWLEILNDELMNKDGPSFDVFGVLTDNEDVCLESCLTQPGDISTEAMNCSVCLTVDSLLKHFTNCQSSFNSCTMCVKFFSLLCSHVSICITRSGNIECDIDICRTIIKMIPSSNLESHVKTLWFQVRKKFARIIGIADVEAQMEGQDKPEKKVPKKLSLVRKPSGSGPLPSIPETGVISNTTLSNSAVIRRRISQMRPPSESYIDYSDDVSEGVIEGVDTGTTSDPEVLYSQTVFTSIPHAETDHEHDADAVPTSSEEGSIEDGAGASAGRKRYASLPPTGPPCVGDTYFPSFQDRPTGIRGIGEVVYADRGQMLVVVTVWEKFKAQFMREAKLAKHYREEGVILPRFRNKLKINKLRYNIDFQWVKVTHLGNGMTGKCHLATDFETDFKFCVKEIHISNYEKDEIELMSALDHENIVQVYGAIRHAEKIYILQEYIVGGCLTEAINIQKKLGRRLSQLTALRYFQQLLKVLVYLKRNNILHEDIKADNILLDRNINDMEGPCSIKVTDFGMARRCQGSVLSGTKPVGTQTQWSPEKAEAVGYGFPAEVWAAVCVLIHMLSGLPPWVRRFEEMKALILVIVDKSPPMEDIPRNILESIQDLIRRGFTVCPGQRPTAEQLLSHAAFQLLGESSGTNGNYSILESVHYGSNNIAEATNSIEDDPGADRRELYRKGLGAYGGAAGTEDNVDIYNSSKTGIHNLGIELPPQSLDVYPVYFSGAASMTGDINNEGDSGEGAAYGADRREDLQLLHQAQHENMRNNAQTPLSAQPSAQPSTPLSAQLSVPSSTQQSNDLYSLYIDDVYPLNINLPNISVYNPHDIGTNQHNENPETEIHPFTLERVTDQLIPNFDKIYESNESQSISNPTKSWENPDDEWPHNAGGDIEELLKKITVNNNSDQNNPPVTVAGTTVTTNDDLVPARYVPVNSGNIGDHTSGSGLSSGERSSGSRLATGEQSSGSRLASGERSSGSRLASGERSSGSRLASGEPASGQDEETGHKGGTEVVSHKSEIESDEVILSISSDFDDSELFDVGSTSGNTSANFREKKMKRNIHSESDLWHLPKNSGGRKEPQSAPPYLPPGGYSHVVVNPSAQPYNVPSPSSAHPQRVPNPSPVAMLPVMSDRLYRAPSTPGGQYIQPGHSSMQYQNPSPRSAPTSSFSPYYLPTYSSQNYRTSTPVHNQQMVARPKTTANQPRSLFPSNSSRQQMTPSPIGSTSNRPYNPSVYVRPSSTAPTQPYLQESSFRLSKINELQPKTPVMNPIINPMAWPITEGSRNTNLQLNIKIAQQGTETPVASQVYTAPVFSPPKTPKKSPDLFRAMSETPVRPGSSKSSLTAPGSSPNDAMSTSTTRSQFEEQDEAFKALGRTAEEALSQHSDNVNWVIGDQYSDGEDEEHQILGELDDEILIDPAASVSHLFDADDISVTITFRSTANGREIRMKFESKYFHQTWRCIIQDAMDRFPWGEMTTDFGLTRFNFKLENDDFIDLDNYLGNQSLILLMSEAVDNDPWWIERGMIYQC